ncbi:MAG TPA: ribose-phosphate pyrophosphokinase [Longimicrobiaceae bacterium]
MDGFILFAGSANRPLAESVAGMLGVTLGTCSVERFPDGEVSVRLEESVRGREVFVLQPTSPPVNDNLVELLAFADACRRAAAERVTVVIPYFGYARADRRKGRRVAVAARMVADLLQAVGIGHVVTLDVHTAQTEALFSVPVDNLSAVPVLCDAVRDRLPPDTVVVSPDLGGVGRATEMAACLGLTTAVVHKRRVSGAEVEALGVIGDVRGRSCLVVDDMIATGSTVVECIRALRAAGSLPGCTVAATHGVFCGDVLRRLAEAGASEVLVTDSIHLPAGGTPPPWLRVASVAPLLASAIRRLARDESLHDLH